jgi:hypothetical protein
MGIVGLMMESENSDGYGVLEIIIIQQGGSGARSTVLYCKC